jgi:GT2 family glycosyltransferase
MNLSIIIPVFNGEETISQVITALLDQEFPEEFEIIAVNDKSQDRSLEILKEFERYNNFRIIDNATNMGESRSFNTGILNAKYDIVVLVEQDCFPVGKDCIKRLIAPLKSKKIVGVVPTYVLPEEVWKKYDFWWKLWFARLVDRRISHLNIKFDAFKKSALLKVGLLDYETYRNSGQDVDLYMKLSKIGDIVKSPVQFRHYHGLNKKGSVKKIFYKEIQYGESWGVFTRKYFLSNTKTWEDYAVLAKPAFVIGSLIPYVQLVCIPALILLAFLYKYQIFKVKDYRLLLVPLVNFASILLFSVYFVIGFIREKQRL